MVKCLILLPKRVSTAFTIPGPLSSCTEFFFLLVCVWLHDIIRNYYHEGMSIYSLGHKCCNTITFAPSPPSMLRSHSCLWIGMQKANGRSNIEGRAEERNISSQPVYNFCAILGRCYNYLWPRLKIKMD